MKNIIFLFAISFAMTAAKPVANPIDKLDNKQRTALMASIVDDYIRSLKSQQEVLRQLSKSKKYSSKVRSKAKAVLPIVASTIKGLAKYDTKYDVAKLSSKEFIKVARKLVDQGHQTMIDADNVIIIVVPGEGGGGGDDDTDPDKPDCSGAFNNIQSACANGVSIKMSCGFYNDNGGAQAVEQALEKCTMDANAAVAACESGSNTNTFGQESAYETNALMVCSQFEDGGLEPDAAQTQTSTGN